jgi:transcriptional regulator with XRE-family HTH domain
LTFGQAVTELRQQTGLNQRELAKKVRKEDGGPISQQYLNDIEHDRRNPTGEHLIKEMAKALNADATFLTWLSGQVPSELRDVVRDPETLKRLIDLARRETTRS